MESVDYNEIFQQAKESTVYAHAMVWIKAVANEEKKLDRQKFNEIKVIFLEAMRNLEEEGSHKE